MRIFSAPILAALLTLGGLSFSPSPNAAEAHPTFCHGKPAAVMDAASTALVSQLSSRALKISDIGGCESLPTGSILGFEHASSTLYLVQATCVRKNGPKTFITAVMECDEGRARFNILGVSWGGSKGHGVAGGPAIVFGR